MASSIDGQLQQQKQEEEATTSSSRTQEGLEQQSLSPAARIFHAPQFNCHIIAVIGCKTDVDSDVVKSGLEETLVNHPRFSSVLVGNEDKQGRKMKWKQLTKVNIEEHVIVPNLDPTNMDSPDQFVEDYISHLTTIPMDLTKPLWEFHILKIKTKDANSVGVFKIHHSLGDGSSLVSLLLACTRKTSDPEALPSIPVQKRAGLTRSDRMLWSVFSVFWTILVIFWNTIVDLVLFGATFLFLEDTKTPIKGDVGVESKPKRIVHRTISLDDIKLVKQAMNMTINDVLLGLTQAGLSRYLNHRYRETEMGGVQNNKTTYIPRKIRLRANILLNLRPTLGIQKLADLMAKKSKNKRGWGNWIGYISVPIKIGLREDPVDYVREAKSAIDRKKQSFESYCSFAFAMLVVNLFGIKVAGRIALKVLSRSTMSFSNLVGPMEEISFYGHPIAYLAPTVYGHPSAITIHFQSYCDKMTIVVAVDPDKIPDTHRLFDEIEESLNLIKEAVLKKEVNNV